MGMALDLVVARARHGVAAVQAGRLVLGLCAVAPVSAVVVPLPDVVEVGWSLQRSVVDRVGAGSVGAGSWPAESVAVGPVAAVWA